MKYRKKPVVIEAEQWFKNGDHSEDKCYYFGLKKKTQSEGKLIRYFRDPDISGRKHCLRCKGLMCFHGWIDTLEGGHIVCVGDWIIKGIKGEFYPCKPDIFDETYEEVK